MFGFYLFKTKTNNNNNNTHTPKKKIKINKTKPRSNSWHCTCLSLRGIRNCKGQLLHLLGATQPQPSWLDTQNLITKASSGKSLTKYWHSCYHDIFASTINLKMIHLSHIMWCFLIKNVLICANCRECNYSGYLYQSI